MADAPDLGSGAARCGGSSPLSRTTSIIMLSEITLEAFLSFRMSEGKYETFLNHKDYEETQKDTKKIFKSFFVSFVTA